MEQELPEAELSRLHALGRFERRLARKGFRRIAGVDEAGRGPLAGPVVAAACVFHKKQCFQDLNDSKKLSAEQRASLYKKLTTSKDISYGIGVIDASIIDQINILQATFLAMQQAVANLPEPPDHLLVDGNMLPPFPYPALPIVEGDQRSQSIAAASIIAKVTRDRMMVEFDVTWPLYGFKKHKGYGTEEHLAALQKFGPCPLHRKSFRPILLD